MIFKELSLANRQSCPPLYGVKLPNKRELGYEPTTT